MRSIPQGQMTLKSPVLIAALACAILFGAAGPVSAKTYTLEQCLKLAKLNRESIQRAEGQERNDAAEVRRQFGRLFLPSISGSYNTSETRLREREQNFFDPTAGMRVDATLPDVDLTGASFSLSAGLMLFDGLSNVHDYLGVRKLRKSSQLNVLRTEQNLELEVKTAYLAYLANLRNLSVQEEAVRRSQEQLNLVQSRYDVGSASLSDVLKQKVRFGNDNLSLLEADNAVQTRAADLAFVVGLNPSDDNSFDTTYAEDVYSGTIESAIQTGLSNHPDLRAARLDVSTMNHFLKSSYGDYLPSLSANVSRSWSDNTSPDPSGQPFTSSSTSTRLGISVRWNIFDQLNRESRVVGRKVAHNNARAAEFELRNKIVKNVKTNYLDVQKATEQVKVSKETVVSASEDMNLAQEKYNLGSASILDLLDAQVSLKEAQVSLIRSKLDLNLAVAKLENAMGS
ncbi:MAG: TolC family protein [candidate division Zixibacteria bacterium]|nr:TolC family protein [candidate division Zixibacteria bacterium]